MNEKREKCGQFAIKIAENDEENLKLYAVHKMSDDGEFYDCIEVFRGKELVYDENIVSADDCVYTSADLFREYEDFRECRFDDWVPFSLSEKFSNEEEIETRESELHEYTTEFIEHIVERSIYLDEDAHSIDRMVEDILDTVINTLVTKYGYSKVYRPCMISDEEGNDIYIEFPYDNIDI